MHDGWLSAICRHDITLKNKPIQYTHSPSSWFYSAPTPGAIISTTICWVCVVYMIRAIDGPTLRFHTTVNSFTKNRQTNKRNKIKESREKKKKKRTQANQSKCSVCSVLVCCLMKKRVNVVALLLNFPDQNLHLGKRQSFRIEIKTSVSSLCVRCFWLNVLRHLSLI